MRELVTTHTAAPIWARLMHGLFFAVLVVVTSFAFPLTDPAPDIFHEGEYAMYGVAGGHVGSGLPPVLAHGGIDVIPTQIAAATCRADQQIVCVRAVNAVFTLACEALFLVVLVMITGLGTARALIGSLPAITTLVAYNGIARSAFFLQTGTPNLRELFILSILAALFWLYRDEGRMTAITQRVVTTVIGFLAGAGLFWIYNRGLFGLLLTGVSVSALAWFWRDWRLLACTIGGCVLGLGVVHITGIYGDTASNFANIAYWQLDNEIYRIPSDISFVKEAAPVIPLYIALCGAAGFVIWRNGRSGHSRVVLALVTLLLVLGFYAFQAYIRTFTSYIAHSLWGLSLLFATLFFWGPRPTMGRGRGLLPMALAAIPTCALAVVFHLHYLPPNFKAWAANLATATRVMTGHMPRDRDLVIPGMVQAAEAVRAAGGTCTYTFSNEGLLYVLTRLPPCSRFAYPLYISPESQAGVLQELEKTRPPVVLWHSPSWANDIYDRSLAVRTPALAAWVPSHYPYSKTVADGYELRALTPFNAAPR